ncbi:MAG: hypothetical protein AAFP84_05140 [Actinomycetota bacterium]
MAESDPLSDIMTLVAAPLAGTIKSVEQFRRGVEEFLRGVENFNATMENLNETAQRINTMLGDVEEPLRAAIPQVTRTIEAADEVMTVMSGPAKAVAPGLTKLAEVLNNPAFAQMPGQLTQVNEMLTEMTTRLTPLGQLAESAGGLLGGFRLPGFGGGADTASTSRAATRTPAETSASPSAPDETPSATKKKAAAKKIAARKGAAKRAASNKAATKTAATKKTARSKRSSD